MEMLRSNNRLRPAKCSWRTTRSRSNSRGQLDLMVEAFQVAVGLPMSRVITRLQPQ
jgi:hypothetical protein